MSVKALFNLTGKTALITGGSRGLGLQMAEALGEMGARLAITARKSDELAEAKAHLQGLGYQVETFTNDLQKFDTIPALVDDVLARCGDIDILVNNAGATWGAKAEEYPDEAWNKVMNLNVSAPFFLTREVARRVMIPKGRGNVIITASVAAFKGTPPGMNTVAYNTSKAAAVHLARTLARNGATTASASTPSARAFSPASWPTASSTSSATSSSPAPRCDASAARRTSRAPWSTWRPMHRGT